MKFVWLTMFAIFATTALLMTIAFVGAVTKRVGELLQIRIHDGTEDEDDE